MWQTLDFGAENKIQNLQNMKLDANCNKITYGYAFNTEMIHNIFISHLLIMHDGRFFMCLH